MAYQSIYDGGKFTPDPKINLKYVAPAPRTPVINPASIKDFKTLQSALRTGQISNKQYTEQFKRIVPVQTPIKPYSAGSILGSSLTAAKNIGKTLTVEPYQILEKHAVDKVKQNVAALTRPTSTQAQRDKLINTQKTAQKNINNYSPETKNLIKQVGKGGGSGTSVQTTKAVQSMIAKGAKDADVQEYLKQQIAQNSQSDIAFAGDLLTATSIPAVVGGTAKLAGKALTKTGVTAAAGKDAAVNTLIDSQKTAAALKTGAKANKVANMGGSVIKEANTTRIPVVSPTESAAARRSVGSVALDNADRTSIPIKGQSTSVAGKVTKPADAAYIKQSNALTKSYEKEVKQLQKLNSPRAQQVLQARLDTKYAKRQADLDSSAGQTNISFNGKAVKQPVVQHPGSAFDKELANAPKPAAQTANGGAGGASTAKTTAIPVKTAKTAPEAPTSVKPAKPTPNTNPPTGETKVAGSSIRTQQEAIQAGMQAEAEKTGATFTGASHKEEAVKAAKLVNEDPNKAMDIAMGRKPADNISHESAVYHAVKNKVIAEAKKTGDWSKARELANAPRHTGVSEAGQKLGAEAYNLDPHDPIRIMSDVTKAREKALGRKAGQTVDKAVTSIKTEVKAATPKIHAKTWDDFVNSIKC